MATSRCWLRTCRGIPLVSSPLPPAHSPINPSLCKIRILQSDGLIGEWAGGKGDDTSGIPRQVRSQQRDVAINQSCAAANGNLSSEQRRGQAAAGRQGKPAAGGLRGRARAKVDRKSRRQ